MSDIHSEKERCVWDAAVIGAGAAGLMSAIHIARRGCKVIVLDSKEKVGAKILMSGGTRCNVTNERVRETDFETENRPVLKAVLSTFTELQARQFFEEIGVPMVLEPGGKYFPVTHSGRSVLEALLGELRRLGVILKTGAKVDSIKKSDARFILKSREMMIEARTVVLATGGLSYPATGSDGSGYTLAASLGHSLVPTSPALTPLLTADGDWKSLSGISLPVRLICRGPEKEIKRVEGDFLFTHTGFSGPSVLDISRYWIRARRDGLPVQLYANFMPSVPEERLRSEMLNTVKSRPTLSIGKFMSAYIPERLVEILLSKLRVAVSERFSQLKREDREKIVRTIYFCPLEVTGDHGYAKAEATAGGIRLEEIDKRTMESKKVPGLFFAGEIVDVEGRIGGYNFQWAWSSGYVAAAGVQKYVMQRIEK